ncbi:hypothetical protein [Streptomyces zagrosensis]|uniref:Uncharacterized protein n=1 Tax=Streptomyces zagrosensis TaxID=1042984 RepID=A0A7W9UZ81_9ACTN|nr:hypothetical protein [Streptomyces zagrosensis]MBB5936121.1 hypothetical protein [Streptomyces zagrosensis]
MTVINVLTSCFCLLVLSLRVPPLLRAGAAVFSLRDGTAAVGNAVTVNQLSHPAPAI